MSDDESPKQYYAIKNWEVYQPALRSKMARKDFVRDYTDRDQDPDFSSLTVFQRGVLNALCRLRGSLGQKIYTNHTYIARAIHALPTDCARIGYALHTLVARGFLIITNQSDNKKVGVERRGYKERRGEERIESTIPVVPPVESPEESEKIDRYFVSFWESYPKHRIVKDERGSMYQLWESIITSGDSAERAFRSLVILVNTEDWTKEAGRFVPGVKKFIEHWQDYEATSKNGNGHARHEDDSLAARMMRTKCPPPEKSYD